MKKIFKSKIFIALIFFGIVLIVLQMLYYYGIIPHKKYDSEHFDIDPYISNTDFDGDGIDDQSDFLNSVKEYIDTDPQYKSTYYSTGYPDDKYGVCTDVVAFGMLGAGYDLMELVNSDINEHPELYDIETVDKNIDFRRVRNLKVYFDDNAVSLTTDIDDIEQWQGGDIVVFEKHIGVVSDSRNSKGVSFVIHNGSILQTEYEQDILGSRNDIVGHYRLS